MSYVNLRGSQHSSLFKPVDHGAHVERQDRSPSALEHFANKIYGKVSAPVASSLTPYQHFVPLVHQQQALIKSVSDKQLSELAAQMRLTLRFEGIDADEPVAKAFALVREAAGRSVGMSHFDSQIMGGRVLLSGKIAEMATGEGKTLTATLPAATAAMAGLPTHVITANDYLAVRDCQEMLPIYQLLGLSVGSVNQDTDQEERRSQYACDITYCTNKDVTFDYLRDSITLDAEYSNVTLQAEHLFNSKNRKHRLNLRGLHFAIVDEADSVLIDDARTPLIISANRGGEAEEKFLRDAYQLSNSLEPGKDYLVDENLQSIFITDQGSDTLILASETLGPLWLGRIRREEIIRQALAVRYFYRRDHQYVVIDDKIQIVDENTGRVLPDRSWERGLHQLIEIKEGCAVSKQRETLARISYQRFFRRYLRLSGMTGTAREVRPELWDVYHLRSVTVPTHKPLQRKLLPTLVAIDAQEHWQQIVEAVSTVHALGRPILIGTATVADSEHISEELTAHGLSHQLLNAKQDSEEAHIVASAGSAGQITVATQMAGRGTDIKLAKEVEQLGGLHVILIQHHDAARIDRQLAGRCARMGDQGSYQQLLLLEHIDSRYSDLRRLSQWVAALSQFSKGPAKILAKLLLKFDQQRTERYQARVRRAVFKQDERQRDLLAISGRSE
ncbi:MAG: DEAD/DEAH box helicase [Oceanicoccus sp.]